MKEYNSCLNCTKRNLQCHSICEDYKRYKEELEKYKILKKQKERQYSYYRRSV